MRIAAETSLSPGWLLIAFPAVLYPTYLLLEVLFGRGLAAAMDFSGDFETRLVPSMAAFFGYVAMMYVYLTRGTIRDLEAVRPVLRGGESDYAKLRRQLTQFERNRLWVGGLSGLVFTLALQEIVVARWTRLLAGEWSLRDPCAAAILIAFWTVLGWGIVCLIDSARLFSRIGEHHVTIDLLDLSPLAPLGRPGLRIVLFMVIATAAGAIVFMVGAPSDPRSMVPVSVIWILSMVMAVAAFVLPVRGLRRQIRTRKAEELSKLRERIRRNRELADGSGAESAEAGAKLPGLLAYMNQIESVREWPFDAPTLTRFFLYVAIPLGSWIGGALVERLLGAALD